MDKHKQAWTAGSLCPGWAAVPYSPLCFFRFYVILPLRTADNYNGHEILFNNLRFIYSLKRDEHITPYRRELV
ncbi:Protein of unknown function [Cotesia congregata]|uniref:Uncharacterized protein n=1 Tax=Cotesia congregata TaxID=51543 RepID=A0A8J2HC95_COTCN|nr:Protein of unknown function [Cotesia congregata]